MLKNRLIRILLIEDEAYDVRRIHNTIKLFKEYIHIQDVVADGHSALKLLKEEQKNYDVIIMDFQIAGSLTGENLISEVKKIDPTLQIIVITKMTINITDFDFAQRLLEAGAMWYCTKYPGDIEEYIYQPTDFILSIFNAYEKRHIEKARLKSDERLSQNIEAQIAQNPIIGISKAIVDLRNEITKFAHSDTNVLIHGYSGTGKELVARHIHHQSSRKYEKFVPINCGSLPQELVESELFGFEKGSFTGASAKKPGLFEIAHKGTVFLDEIAELPKAAQVKLLRFLQDGEIDKIGRTGKIKVDVRVIAATNTNLEKAVQDKRFREDLFYRLNVVSIYVPELNKRKEDIPLLVNHFLGIYSRDMSKEVPKLDEKSMSILINYKWPGNVRQLQNVLQRLILSGDRDIASNDVKSVLSMFTQQTDSANIPVFNLMDNQNIMTWREVEQKVKERYFRFVRQNSDSDSEAARKLGLAPPNYHRMCKELGIK